MNKKQIFFLIFLILPHFSFSDTFSVDDKFYFGFGAGVINPNDVDIDITVAETINGVAFSVISMVNLNSMLVIKSRLF